MPLRRIRDWFTGGSERDPSEEYRRIQEEGNLRRERLAEEERRLSERMQSTTRSISDAMRDLDRAAEELHTLPWENETEEESPTTETYSISINGNIHIFQAEVGDIRIIRFENGHVRIQLLRGNDYRIIESSGVDRMSPVLRTLDEERRALRDRYEEVGHEYNLSSANAMAIQAGDYWLQGRTDAMLSSANTEEEQKDYTKILGYRKTRDNTQDLSGDCNLCVGYEVEKNSFIVNDKVVDKKGKKIGSYELFRGYETDSSCGFEAITHILPLSSNTELLSKVRGMMEEARTIIDSPANESCGGHISISHKEMSVGELLVHIRGNMSIVYALYKGRLRNSYSSSNKWLSPSDGARGVVNVTKDRLEIRLPSAVKSVEQLMNRHELIAILVEHSLKHRDNKFDELIGKLTPIMLRMYDNNHDKVNEIIELSKLFREYLLDYKIHDDIKEYLVYERKGATFSLGDITLRSPSTSQSVYTSAYNSSGGFEIRRIDEENNDDEQD